MSNTNDNEIVDRFATMQIPNEDNVISREVAFCVDGQNGSYNGSISFDLSSLGTSGRWLSYSEAYLQIPYVISIRSTVDNTATPGTIYDLICLKDGFHQIIDSVLLEIDGRTVVQSQPLNNIHTHFKLLTTCNQNDLIKNRATNGFYGDHVGKITYSSDVAGSLSGNGYMNNVGAQTALRRGELVLNIQNNALSANIINKEEAKHAGRSYYDMDNGVGVAKIYYFVYMAQIKLSDITDLYNKIPISRATSMRLTLNYNSVKFNIVSVGVDAAGKKLMSNFQQISGNTNPILVADNEIPAQTLSIEGNIMRTSMIVPSTLALTSCRLYVPIYKLSDKLSLEMISTYPQTKFQYNDVYSYVLQNIAPNSNFVHTLNTGVVDPMYVLVVPFLKTNETSTIKFTGLTTSTYQSPFSSDPGTNFGSIKDFNCALAGLNVFSSNMRYDFEQFNDQLSKINAQFGGNVKGLTSGLINMFLFQQGHRYYVADLSRKNPSEAFTTKSVVITGVNSSPVPIELICFVAYRKSLSLNTSTGQIVE